MTRWMIYLIFATFVHAICLFRVTCHSSYDCPFCRLSFSPKVIFYLLNNAYIFHSQILYLNICLRLYWCYIQSNAIIIIPVLYRDILISVPWCYYTTCLHDYLRKHVLWLLYYWNDRRLKCHANITVRWIKISLISL